MMDAHENLVANVAGEFPKLDLNGYLAEAKFYQQAFHQAVMDNDLDRRAEASLRYAALVWRMNGKSWMGCACEGHSGHRFLQHCRAVPGEVPQWGQLGEFLVTVNDRMRVLVRYKPDTTLDCSSNLYRYEFMAQFEYHAVDFDGPFVSETGYRSDYVRKEPEGLHLDEYARYAIIEHLYEKGKRLPLVYIRPDEWCRTQPLPSWVKGDYPGPKHLLRKHTGQQLELFG